MNIYKLYKLNSMGFELEERYYLDEKKAHEEYDKMLEELRKDDNTLSDEDCQEHYGYNNFQKERVILSLQPNRKTIDVTNVWVWEYLETDCGIEHEPTKIDVCLERIQVIE